MNAEEKEKVLARLHEDVRLCKDYLQSILDEIASNEISNYPIFVATRVPVAIGKLLVHKKELDIEWSFYVSHLEEFAIKEIVAEDKIENFQKLYKSHPNDFCFFVILNEEFNFIFIPKKTLS